MTMKEPHGPPPEDLILRLRRAKSWLERAEMESDDPDAAFVFYWIAFDAAYGRDRQRRLGTRAHDLFDDFFETIISIDLDEKIGNAIWDKFSSSVRMLLSNQYVYKGFWDHVFGKGCDDWERTFDSDRQKGLTYLAVGYTRGALNIIFDRLYVVRNQIMHGGATWRKGRNRDQVRDGAAILAMLVPIFIELMERNPQVDWGLVDYRLVDETGSILGSGKAIGS